MSLKNQKQGLNALSIEEINKMIVKYEQKLLHSINTNNNFQNAQIQHVKNALQENQHKITIQKKQIQELASKIQAVQDKLGSKLLSLQKQLQNFQLYYNKCYEYTLNRVNQISLNVTQFTNLINNQMQNQNLVQAKDYVNYATELVKKIVKDTSLKTQQLKHYVDSQLFQLQLHIGSFINNFQQIDKIADQLKSINYGNQSLQQVISNASKSLKTDMEIQEKQTSNSKKIIGYFEPKFKQIIKRMNSYSIQIELVKSMIICDSKDMNVRNQLKQKQFDELHQRLDELETLIQEQKKTYQKQLNKKEETLKKRHDRILQLEQSLHTVLQKEIKMSHQIAQLKMHNMEYSKEIQKYLKKNKKDWKSVDTQTQNPQKSTFLESSVSHYVIPQQKVLQDSQKLILTEIQYQNLQIKYQQFEKQFDLFKKMAKTQNKQSKPLSKSQLTNSYNLKDQIKTLNIIPKPQDSSTTDRQTQRSSKSCIKNYKNYEKGNNSLSSSNINQNSITQLYKQNQRLQKNNIQINKIRKQLQNQIIRLLNTKSKQNQQDEEYLDKIEIQLQKNTKQIQKLNIIILQLNKKVSQSELSKQKLQEQILIQNQDFQQKLQNYSRLVHKLEKEKQNLINLNKQLQRNIGQTDGNKSIHSHYGQKSLSPFRNYTLQNTNLDLKHSKPQQKKVRKYSTFLYHLEHAILSMGLPIPIFCQVNEKGYVKQHKTGAYLVDHTKNPIRLTQSELKAAIQKGLLLM